MYTSIVKPYHALPPPLIKYVLVTVFANRNLLVFVHKVRMCIRRVHVRSYMCPLQCALQFYLLGLTLLSDRANLWSDITNSWADTDNVYI